jgi:hypothetical protein
MPLEKKAKKVYNELKSTYENFPNRLCKIAAMAMYEKGYGIIEGKVVLDDYCKSGKTVEIIHYWNYDLISGKEIDICSEQFNGQTKRLNLQKCATWFPKERPPFYKVLRKRLLPSQVY